MKKTTVIIAAFILLMATSCNSNSPKSVAQKFLTAYMNGDNNTIEATISKESQPFWNQFKNEGYANDVANLPKDQKDTYTFKSGETNGDFSTQDFVMGFTIPSQHRNGNTNVSVSLTKENGRWKVILKNTLQSMK